MTKLLEQAFNEAAKLPEKQQDAVAALLLEELTSEARWDAAFAGSQDKLSTMAARALTDFRAGKTLPFANDGDLTHD